MRIPSGVTDQYIAFVGIQGSDTAATTRQTGMQGKFSVVRSRNAADWTAMTTPTVTEGFPTTAPGVYWLLLDEDMSVAAGNYSEEMAFHITTTDTAASTDSIYPITRTIELYNDRMATATDRLAALASGGGVTVPDLLSTLTTNVAAIETSITFATKGIQDDIIPGVATATRGVNLITVNLESATDQISSLATGGGLFGGVLKVGVDFATERIHFISTGGGPFPGGAADSAAIADAVWDEAFAEHTTATTFGHLKTQLNFATGGIKLLNDNNPQAGDIADAVWDEAFAAHAVSTTFGHMKTQLNFATGEVAQLLVDMAAVKATVDTATERISFLTTGGGPFPGSGGLTVAEIADGVWDEAFADHNTVTTFGHMKTQLNSATGRLDALATGGGALVPDLLALVRTGVDTATERISYLSTGGGPFPGGGSAPSAATIADAVWDEAFGDHNTVTTFGHLKTQLNTATGRLVDLATGGGVAVPDLIDTNKTALNFATGEIAQLLVDVAALNDISVSDILTTQMTEAYSADGVAPTLAQALFLIQQSLGDFSIAGTTLTVKKVDGSTTAATFTLSDATAPTSLTRAA